MTKLNYTKKWQWDRFKESQDYPYVIDFKTGKKYKRIKFGDEEYQTSEKYCHDCGVTKGNFHWIGCDAEESPIPSEKGLQLLVSERAKEFSR